MRFLDSLFGKNKEVRPEEGNPVLVQAMHQLALNDSSENRKQLYDAFLGSMLLVPVPEIPPGLTPGLQTTKTNVELQLTTVLDRNERRVTAAFTDIEALRNWDPNTPYLGLKAQDLFRFVMGTDIQEIVVNPFDPIRKMIRPGGRITRAELDFLSKGVIPSRIGPKGVEFQIKANEKVAIGLPSERPSAEIEELLRSKASGFSEIDALYLFQMATQAGSSHTVIGIQLSKALPESGKQRLREPSENVYRPS
ncbi:MAG: SseB family protein [Acidobacteriia bacterium]|nr:SseB family protein [Terriglobia bacterium]